MLRPAHFSMLLLFSLPLAFSTAACGKGSSGSRDTSVGVDGGTTDTSVPPDTTVPPDTGTPPACSADSDCDDGVFCNGAEACDGGSCKVATPVDCDDGFDCTDDLCDEEADVCRYFPNDAECGAGQTCSPATGCIAECTEDAECDDGLFCNGPESCVMGSCTTGALPACDDGITCTADVCDEIGDSCRGVPDDGACGTSETCSPATGCIAECTEDAECDDGLFCNGGETCVAGSCTAGAAPDCNDGIACTRDVCDEIADACGSFADDTACGASETCDAALGCVPNCTSDLDCADGVFCNGAELCVAGACIAGTPRACGDAIACTTDLCDETARICRNLPDDSLCAATETCSAASGCIPECTMDAQCDDGLFCNGAEICVVGSCAAGVAPGSDGFACTTPFCNESLDRVLQVPDDSVCVDDAWCNGAEFCDTASGCQVTGVPTMPAGESSDLFGHRLYRSSVTPAACAHSFTDISATGTAYTAGDDRVVTIPLGGTGFTLYGASATSVRVDSNSIVRFNLSASTDLSNGCGAAGMTGTDVALLVLHDDTRLAAFHHRYFATCPRAHDFDPSIGCNIIQWTNVYHFGASSSENWDMQAVLYEGTEDVAYVYSGAVRENGSSATVGIRNNAGAATDSIEVSCNTPASVQNDSTVCFYDTSACP